MNNYETDVKQRIRNLDKLQRRRNRKETAKSFARTTLGLIILVPLIIIVLYFATGFLSDKMELAPGADTESETAATAAAFSHQNKTTSRENPFKYAITREQVKSKDEQDEYRTVIKLEVETILAEYNSAWDDLWRFTNEHVTNGKQSLKINTERMKSLELNYNELNTRIKALHAKTLSDENKALLAQVKQNMLLASTSRANAAKERELLFQSQANEKNAPQQTSRRIRQLLEDSDQYMNTALILNARMEQNILNP